MTSGPETRLQRRIQRRLIEEFVTDLLRGQREDWIASGEADDE